MRYLSGYPVILWCTRLALLMLSQSSPTVGPRLAQHTITTCSESILVNALLCISSGSSPFLLSDSQLPLPSSAPRARTLQLQVSASSCVSRGKMLPTPLLMPSANLPLATHLVGHVGVVFLESLREPLAAGHVLLDAASDAAILALGHGLGGEVVDAGGEA